jgi:signal transduction histidine kinase
MHLLDLTIEARVIIGISAMVLLFVSFLISFISSQRRKLRYHNELHALHEEQQRFLTDQNLQLEQKVQERTNELARQKEELQKSLIELKATQLQLVQREKMASLGEMAAGIAHEMQNPLNFVNNFSELGIEILKEAKDEVNAGHLKMAVEALDVARENWMKVIAHGKRAEAIVKSMMEHSRAERGESQLSDLNALVDEFLKLAYHSYRSKDNSFEAVLETHFDPTVGMVNVLPQDIGRVLINLFNNAFYSVQQKKRKLNDAFVPVVQVSTNKNDDKVEVSIKDNGIGIPQKILHKIYQPFFTTKPAGEGTGLGLSLSYDIITKGHGGELSVESQEGSGAEFVFRLPA